MSASTAEGGDGPVGEGLDCEAWADLGREGQEKVLSQRLEDSDEHDPTGPTDATAGTASTADGPGLDPREQLNTMAAIQDYVEHETWKASLLGGHIEMEFRVITNDLGERIEAIQDVIFDVESAEAVEEIDDETIADLEATEAEFDALLAEATTDPDLDEAFWRGERQRYPDILKTEAVRVIVDRHNSKDERIKRFRSE